MKVLVAGGRDFNDTEFIYKELDTLHKQYWFSKLIEGDAKGVDRIAGFWARKNKIINLKYPADWNQYGKKAGWIRNNLMADQNPGLVVLFPGGVGTKMMKDIAEKRKFKVIDYGE